MKSPPAPNVLNVTQITHDHRPKSGPLLSDNARIYFNEISGDQSVLAQVSTSGGEVAAIPTPFTNSQSVDISHDRSQLLVESFSVTEPEEAVWAVPLPAGSRRRVADI